MTIIILKNRQHHLLIGIKNNSPLKRNSISNIITFKYLHIYNHEYKTQKKQNIFVIKNVI